MTKPAQHRRSPPSPAPCCSPPAAARSTPPNATARSSARRSATCATPTHRDDADEALDDINEQLDDLGNKYALYTAEDRADIQNNLADLAEHAIQGSRNLAQQDLAVLERSADNIAEDVNETRSAAWEGVLEGLADCTQ